MLGKDRKQLLLSLSILLLLGLAIWWFSDIVVWLGDDLDYGYMMKGEIWQSWDMIQSWHDFWLSQWTHYLNVNGRFVAHCLVQVYCGLLDRWAFSISNAFVYMFFALALAKAGGVSISKNPGGILTAACLSVLCFVTKMMPTCQIGYIWGMTVNLVWLMLFFRDNRPKWLTVILMSLFGIIAGNWQESISIGVSGAIGLWWISTLFKRDISIWSRIDWRRSWMILGYVVGTATNCLSPSTIGRVASESIPWTDQILVASYSLPAVMILIAVILWMTIRNKGDRPASTSKSIQYSSSKWLFWGMVILIVFNALIGVYSNRQLFGANMFAAVLLLRILPEHRFNKFFNFMAGLAVLILWGVQYTGIKEVRKQYDHIMLMFMTSNDGSVIYNRTRVMTFGSPSNAKYYEDILGQFNNDLHHSMMKDFFHKKKKSYLKILPDTREIQEMTRQYAPGHFFVTVKEPRKDEPKRKVLVYGHYSIAGILDIEAAPRELELSVFSRRRSPFVTTIIIPEYPLFHADSIQILPSNNNNLNQ